MGWPDPSPNIAHGPPTSNMKGKDMKIILHMIERIDSDLHPPDLILLLLSLRLCYESWYPHMTEGGCGEGVIMMRLLTIGLVGEVKAMECEEASEEAIVRENSA